MTTKKTSKKPKPPKRIKIPAKVLKYLEKAGVKHEILEHKTVYTAIDAAMTIKKKLNEIAKSLLVKADKDYYLVLMPADNNLNFEKLKKVIGKVKAKEIKTIKIPGEKIIENALKIKAGSITAFGKLHKVGVIIDKKFGKVKKAVFAAGTPNYSIEMAVKDFIDLEKAIVGVVGKKKKIKKQAVSKPKKKKTEAKKMGVKKKK
ncbi:YbaK/EbsC family protein [Candidatus Parcubacteria bacterium]|nr:YbaK/EbsC family protein [Candidatus Parcubacteria bacterium]